MRSESSLQRRMRSRLTWTASSSDSWYHSYRGAYAVGWPGRPARQIRDTTLTEAHTQYADLDGQLVRLVLPLLQRRMRSRLTWTASSSDSWCLSRSRQSSSPRWVNSYCSATRKFMSWPTFILFSFTRTKLKIWSHIYVLLSNRNFYFVTKMIP